MTNKDFIGLFPDALAPEHCQAIIKEMDDNEKYDAVSSSLADVSDEHEADLDDL